MVLNGCTCRVHRGRCALLAAPAAVSRLRSMPAGHSLMWWWRRRQPASSCAGHARWPSPGTPAPSPGVACPRRGASFLPSSSSAAASAAGHSQNRPKVSPAGSGSRTRTGGSARSWSPARKGVNHAGYEQWMHADRTPSPACQHGCGHSSGSDASRSNPAARSPSSRSKKKTVAGKRLARARGTHGRSCHDPMGFHPGLFASASHKGRALARSMGRARRPGGRRTDGNRRGADRPLQLAMPACRRYLDLARHRRLVRHHHIGSRSCCHGSYRHGDFPRTPDGRPVCGARHPSRTALYSLSPA